MTATLLPAAPPPAADADATLPEVRLDVRVGSGRVTGYDLTRGEFLVGGANGCDVRLPGSHLPPVVCHFTRTADGLTLRRLAPAFPILLNGAPLSAGGPVPVNHGDRVAVGSADIAVTVSGGGHLRPTFHPEAKAAPQPVATAALAQERAALDRYKAQVEEQARELEADRVAWYRRRQEIEAEVNAARGAAAHAGKLADRDNFVRQREEELAAREQELAGVRDELTDIRQQLFAQYRERREQLEQMDGVVRGAAAAVQDRQAALDSATARRKQELDAEAGRIHSAVTAEVDRRTAALETDFRRRKLELEVQHEARLRQVGQQADGRRDRFAEELRSLEPRLAEVQAQRDQLALGWRELEAQQAQLTAMRDDLARERSAVDAERKWDDERRAERERVFAAREAELDRQEDLIRQDRGTTDDDRGRHAHDLLRLDRWQASLEDRQLDLDRRAAEVDQRLEQIVRDATELEEHTRLADAERQRAASETGRIEKAKFEQDKRAAELAERAAHLEAQQATLGVLRARLDRQEHDLHRETAALTADRARQDAAQRELDDRLRDAERIRASLGTAHTTTAEAERALAEQRRLLETTLGEIGQQKESLAAEAERLKQKELDLDRRSADIAEQTAVMTARTSQVLDLRQRLESDRTAVRSREGTLTDAEAARLAFQEQLRKRAEELTARGKDLDIAAATLADDRLALDRVKAELAQDREQAEQTVAAARKQLSDREQELVHQTDLLRDREVALERQVNRLRETGRTVAAGRKELFEARAAWQAEEAALLERTLAAKRDVDAFRARASAEVDHLRTQAPGLEDQARVALEQLANARDVLRGQLNELHQYAKQSRDTLDAVRTDLRAEAERIRGREAELEAARGEHRLAVAEFRGQLLDWQSRVGELKTAMARSETRIEQRQADLDAAARRTDETAVELARRMERLRLEQDDLSDRRGQIERHLADMREWYRKKLRDLAADRADSHPLPPAPPPRMAAVGVHAPDLAADVEPGDRHLGELLRSLELVDADSLAGLFAEAARQRRTLRHVLLASGAVTLYQLALIEAGNLDALMLGRFRVVDRVRVSPREAVYRVVDPISAHDGGLCVLRVLGDAEMHDATHPDEYRQRFAAALAAPHPNLVATREVLDVNGRPAAVQEWAAGLPGSEWPTLAASGVWLKLLADAAAGLDAAHRGGLVHGRLTADSFLLTADGTVKVGGFGDPPWLTTGLPPTFEPTPAADLRALGQVAFVWADAGAKKRGRGKAFPEPLLAVLRRLETDPANPMGDTASGAEPYRTTAELLADLRRLAAKFPPPADAWAELLAQVNGDESPVRKAG